MAEMFRLEGGSELSEALKSLSTRVSRSVKRDALKEAAEPMRARMAQLAPHEPGLPDLRDMMVVSNARGFDLNEQGVAVGPTKAGFYGSFQEFGTAHHAAQPFARPAFDLTAQQSLQILVAVMWRELARRGISRTIGAPVTVQPGPGGGVL